MNLTTSRRSHNVGLTGTAAADTLRRMLPRGLRPFAIAAAALLGFPGGEVRAAEQPAAPATAGTIDRTPEFVQKVNRAIDLGVTWLKAAEQADGRFADYPGYPGGIDALAYHTLRVCGVPRDDPAATRAWDALKRTYQRAGKTAGLETYSAGLLLMAIAEHGERVREAGSDREVKLSDADRNWAEEVTHWLVRCQTAEGTWSYSASEGGGRRRNYDHSNTQYALLGLKAAARCGIAVESRVWKLSLQHFLSVQDTTGPDVLRFDADGTGRAAGSATSAAVTDKARGWGYIGSGGAYGSMTAGGVGSVVICRSELLGTPAMTKALEAESERSLRDGIAWLGRNFTVRTNPGPNGTMAGAGWHFYYLYAIERAGVLAGVEWMADHDWYGEGADHLCGDQDPGGSWNSVIHLPGRPGGKGARGVGAPGGVILPQAVHDTCFALLFLKKGTIPVRRGALTRAGDDSDINFAAARNLTGTDFGDFLDLVLLRWRRATDDSVKGRLFEGATTVGPKLVEPLLVRMDSHDVEDRIAAHALLKFATGVDHGFDPAAPREKREDAVVAWQGWWLAAKDRLFYDPATKRLATTK